MTTTKFANDHVITVLVNTCPKRHGSKSAKVWQVYKSGQTVAEYMEAHKKANAHYTPMSCLTWDTKHKFVSVGPAKKAAPAAQAVKA